MPYISLDDYIRVGVCLKPHGHEGWIRIHLDDGFIDSVQQAHFVWIKIDGKPVPFKIKQINFDNHLLILLETINTKEKAKIYNKFELSLLPDQIVHLNNQSYIPENYVGYKILDINSLSQLGTIQEIIPFPEQEMARIIYQNRNLLIPIVHDWIVKIESENQTIHMNLPDGLIDL